jgi:hypothetical protein
MIGIAELDKSRLPQNHLFFLSSWGVAKEAIYYPVPEVSAGVYIWHGNFFNGETIAIVGREDMCQDTRKDPLFIGVACEQEFDPAAPFDVYIDSALTLVQGLHGAIDLLNGLRGLPDGRKLNLRFAQGLE